MSSGKINYLNSFHDSLCWRVAKCGKHLPCVLACLGGCLAAYGMQEKLGLSGLANELKCERVKKKAVECV